MTSHISKSARALARLIRTPALDVRVTNGGAVVQFDQPGFAYGDFDRTGSIPVWALQKHLDINRMIQLWKPQYFYIDQPVDGMFPMGHSQSLTVAPNFYNHVGLNFPLTFRFEPHYLGRCSITMRLMVYERSNMGELLELIKRVVYVDENTRKPSKVPADVARHFKDSIVKPEYIKIPPAPQNCFQTERRVYHSDYDYRYHVNSAVYPRWCLDAAAELSLDGKLSSFTGDIAEYKLSTVQMLHHSETYVPDTVVVKVWECTNQQYTLFFQIDKINEQNTTKALSCKMQFYAP